jgi:hypothetical protein
MPCRVALACAGVGFVPLQHCHGAFYGIFDFFFFFFCCRVCLGANLRLQGSFFGLLVDILGQILLGLFWPPHGPFVSFFFIIILVQKLG